MSLISYGCTLPHPQLVTPTTPPWWRRHNSTCTSCLQPPNLTTPYRGTIESLLTNCISVWCGSCRAVDRKSLQRVMGTAEEEDHQVPPAEHWEQPLHIQSPSLGSQPTPPTPIKGQFPRQVSGRRFCSHHSRAARFTNSFSSPWTSDNWTENNLHLQCSAPLHPCTPCCSCSLLFLLFTLV